jgi:cytochrome oxidase Cu insertion factor (SCO1/SenC/PrrC family)
VSNKTSARRRPAASRGPGTAGQPGRARAAASRGPGTAGQPSRSPQAAIARRRRARRGRWLLAGAGAAVLAAVIAVIVTLNSGTRSGGTPAGLPGIGTRAPAGSFTTVSGATRTISSLRGQPTLLWLVTTWCPGCQAGTAQMPAELARLRARGVRIVELEDYADLGQPGPGIAAFAKKYAGAASRSPDWVFGTASLGLTRAYNRQGYLDIYYLLDSSGRIAYINAAPASTMGQLLAHVRR